MDVIQDLVSEIQRIQCLVCAFRRDEYDGRDLLPIGELVAQLRISPSECGRVVRTLAAEGLFEAVPDPAHPLPRAVRLTPTGRQYVERWSASLGSRERA